ncbi:MAG: hypothetical protein ACYTGX_08025 [Planctomycetota bacterium]|jgi:hypothetical protein
MNNERVALHKPQVQEVLAKDFVFIKLYTNQGSDEQQAQVKKLRNRFKGAANPWYVFLTPDERELKRFGSTLTLEGFLADLEWAKEQAGRTAKAH